MDDPRLEAEGELSLARLALDDGELGHAADHVANAVALDPTAPEVHRMLVDLAHRPDGGPELFPLDGQVFLGTAVARAHALAACGSPGPALDLLVSAQRHAPDGRWADAPWLADPALPAAVSGDDWVTVVSGLIDAVDEPADETVRTALAPYVTALRGAISTYPDDARLAWTLSLLTRRLGLLDEAVTLAERSERIEPSEPAALALGYAYRAQHRIPDAERAWRRALDHAPDNLAVYADMAEMLADNGRLDDGIGWAEAALTRDPTHDCASIVHATLVYRRDRDVDVLVALADRLRAADVDSHEAEHADAALTGESRGRAWLGFIPPPTEAVINVLHQLLGQEGGTAGADLTVSAPEPPSALLACRLAVPGLTVTISDVPAPDARRAVPEVFDSGLVRHVRPRLWAYREDTAYPLVGAPDPRAAGAVADAARPWRHLPSAYDDAVRLATVDLPDLLGVLASPPPPPAADPGAWPDWVRLVQAWACLGIAHHRTDEPWPDSTRRAVLVDLAYGPEDWVSEAALLALAATAWVDPAVREDVAELVAWRLMAAAKAAPTRAVTILGSLAALTLATPGVHPDVRRLATDIVGGQPED